MNDKERKQLVAEMVKEAVTERLSKVHDITVIDITPLELSVRWTIPGRSPKYYRVKVSEAY